MRPASIFTCAATIAVGVCAVFSSSASAGELTDVVDAFDYENDDPMDFHIEPSFRYESHTGTVSRESPSNAGETATFAELDYNRQITALDIDVQLGLYRDLEFHVSMPVILSDQRVLEFANPDNGVVNRENSSVQPSVQRIAADLNPGVQDAFGDAFGTYEYFSVFAGNEGASRSGVGDVLFGLAWSPISGTEHNEYATLTFGFDYVAPTGQPARSNNDAVGTGVHELQWSIAASRQFEFLEPYFGVRYHLPIASNNSLFDMPDGSTQQYRGPGMRGEVTAGTEFIVYQDVDTDQHYAVDLGLDFGYQHAGRDYNPLFDGLGRSSCNGTTPAQTGTSLVDENGNIDGTVYEPDASVLPDDAACAWVTQSMSNADPNPSRAQEDWNFSHDGITDVDSYTFVGGHAALYLQFSTYIELRVVSSFSTQSDHFLTSANTGENFGDASDGANCRDDENYVSLNPQCGERNPYYNPTLDGVGRRFFFEGAFDFSLSTTLALQF